MNIAEKYMTDMELNEPSNPLEINKTEDKLKIKFPEQYKKFLLSHNGAEGSIGENSYLVIWSIEDTLNFVSSVNSMSIKEIVTESGFARFTVLIFAQALFFISVKLMLKLLATTSENFNAVEWIAIILILAISIIMMFLLHLIAIDSTQRLYINLLILTIVAVNIIIFYMIDSISVKNNQKKELELLKIQEQYSHQYIENASQQYE